MKSFSELSFWEKPLGVSLIFIIVGWIVFGSFTEINIGDTSHGFHVYERRQMTSYLATVKDERRQETSTKFVYGYALTKTVRLPDIKVYFGPVETTRQDREKWVKYVQKLIPIAANWTLSNESQKINGPEEKARWLEIATVLDHFDYNNSKNWQIPKGTPDSAVIMGHNAFYCFPAEEEAPKLNRTDYVKVRIATPKFRKCKNLSGGFNRVEKSVHATCPLISGKQDFRPT